MRKVIISCLMGVLLLCAGCASQATPESDIGTAAGQVEASGASGSASDGQAGSGEAADSGAAEQAPLEQADIDALRALLEPETADKLIAAAKNDADAAWIAAHPDAFAKYGDALQVKLLKLAADDPEALPFVRDYPRKAPADEPELDAPAMDEGSPSPDVPQTAVPHFYQWDRRWGYTRYSADGFGLAGCGPTAMAMVYQGLTGNDDLSPYDMGKIATDNGYVIYDQGTTNEFFTELPAQLGLVWWYADNTPENIVSTLRDGCLIIANVGVGYFSTVGHFFVLAGVTDDGMVILNDPYSVTRSSQLWDPALISSESIALYGYAVRPAWLTS